MRRKMASPETATTNRRTYQCAKCDAIKLNGALLAVGSCTNGYAGLHCWCFAPFLGGVTDVALTSGYSRVLRIPPREPGEVSGEMSTTAGIALRSPDDPREDP